MAGVELALARPMPIASVVLTTASDPPLRTHALAQLLADPRIELGELQGDYLPAVLDTATAEEGEALACELEAIVGVLRVDVVGINFDDEGDA